MRPELAKLSDAQVAAFERELSRAVTNLNKRLTSLLTKLEIVNGRIVKTPFNLQYLAQLQPQMEQALVQSGYLDAVQNLQAGDAELLRAVRENSPLKLIYTKTDATTLNALAQMQNSEFYGIGTNAMEAIRQTVMNSVLAGARLEDGLGIIRTQLETRLQPYAWTYANTSKKQTLQMANDLAAQNIPSEERFWAYNGPLDDVTRDACIELLEIGYFTDAEREEAEARTADERAYNCRHSFDLVSESTYKENRGDSPTDSGDNIIDGGELNKGGSGLRQTMDSRLGDSIETGWNKITDSPLSKKEFESIQGYTRIDYESVNGYLRNPKLYSESKHQWIPNAIENIDSALQKLPAYDGVVTRYAHRHNSKFIDDILSMKPGDIIRSKGYMSTSRDWRVFNHEGHRVEYIIKSHNGRAIETVADRLWEREVLFARDTKFRIDSVKKVVYMDGATKIERLRVYMEEI